MIRTQPTGIATSLGRWSLGLLTLILATTSFLVLTRARPRAVCGSIRHAVPRLKPIDAGVLVSLSLLSLVVPALYDDGWVLTRSEMLWQRWWFGAVHSTSDAWLPQGFLHELALGWLQRLGWHFVHLRILMAVGLALSWVVLRHFVLTPALGRRKSQQVVAASVFVAFSGAWLVTIRAEPVVVMLGTLVLAASVSMRQRPRASALAFGIVVAALAVGAHQSGWVVISPLLFMLHTAVHAARSDRQQVPPLVAAVLVAGSISLLTVFLAVDLRTALSGARDFATTTHQSGILAEPARYVAVLTDNSGAARVFTVLLLFVLAMGAALAVGISSRRRQLWLVSFGWLGGLLLTSSKWPWHVGVYAIPATVFAALTIDAWQQRERQPGMGRAAVLPLVTLTAATAFTFVGRWGEGDLTSLAWSTMSELVVGETRRYGWYCLIVASAAIGVVADRGRLRRTATAALAMLIVAPLAVSMAWIALDSSKPGWSAAGSNLRQISGSDACGALTREDVIVGADPLTESVPTKDRGSTEDQSLAPDAYPRVPAVMNGPLEGEVPVWGTWFQDAPDETADAQTGSMRSPEYNLSGRRPLTLWTASGATDGLSVRAVFSNSKGEVETVTIPITGGVFWALHTIDTPREATEVRVEIEDELTANGGWAAVSAPALARTSPAPSVFKEARGYTSPFVATKYPCVALPDLGKGYWTRINYLVARGFYFNEANYHELTATQVSCVPELECISQLDYRMADISLEEIG
jgi:hypothetical protein